jgi:hypothetical protein
LSRGPRDECAGAGQTEGEDSAGGQWVWGHRASLERCYASLLWAGMECFLDRDGRQLDCADPLYALGYTSGIATKYRWSVHACHRCGPAAVPALEWGRACHY